MIGQFAISKAGHDKGEIYIIIREDAEYVYLADGRLKLMDSPKKKRKKHIQIIKRDINENLYQLFVNNKPVKNEEVKRAIKLYKAAK